MSDVTEAVEAVSNVLRSGRVLVQSYPEERPQPSRLVTHGLTEDELLLRAVQNARARGAWVEHPRWTAVKDLFLVGSTVAQELCRRYGFDPDEMVPR